MSWLLSWPIVGLGSVAPATTVHFYTAPQERAVCEYCPTAGVESVGRMIAKDYFKRQAKTLRKMVRVTKNETVANRLSSTADAFDNRSACGTDESSAAVDRPPKGATDREHGSD